MAELGGRQLTTKTIKPYLSDLRSAHVDRGFTESLAIFHDPVVERVVDGIRKRFGKAGSRERLPLTRDLLLRIVAKIDVRTLQGAALHAAFCLAFAAFLRVGEFTYSQSDYVDSTDFSQWHVTRASVKLAQSHLELTVPASKTDLFRQGITLMIAATGDDACPLASLTRLTTAYPAPPSSPLFLFDHKRPFDRHLVVDTLRGILKSMDIQGNYSGHSFRRGAATSARISGLDEATIQTLGRWKSDAYKKYIQWHPDMILAASRRHQAVTPL